MLRERFENTISKFHMQSLYDGAILGFSGGADSSLLLYLLKDKVKNLLCVHVNHQIRGVEAERDEEFAKKTCEKYGVSFKSVKVDIPALAKEQKKGLEETARDARYELFNRLLLENPQYKCILTAHNLDDSAETVIFNLTRGTGPQGLMGIKPVQGKIMRPLIEISKGEIVEYCRQNGIEYITDSTNSDTVYTRNRIRHNIIPELQKINPELYASISRLGDILRNDSEHFDTIIEKIITENEIENKIPLKILDGLDYSLKTRLLRRVSRLPLDYTSLENCIELLSKSAVGSLVNLPGGVSFKIERDYAHFVLTRDLAELDFYHELKEGVNQIPEINRLVLVNSKEKPIGYLLEHEIKLKSEKIKFPLAVRSKRDGDTILHGKMTKKLKKVFVDKHIPSHMRTKIPLILSNGEIISVPGVLTKDGISGNDFIITIFRRENEND